MAHERRPLFLEIDRHEEYVELDEEEMVPIEGTRTAFLRLKAPDGRVIRAEIPHVDLYPLLALMWPDDFSSFEAKPGSDAARAD